MVAQPNSYASLASYQRQQCDFKQRQTLNKGVWRANKHTGARMSVNDSLRRECASSRTRRAFAPRCAASQSAQPFAVPYDERRSGRSPLALISQIGPQRNAPKVAECHTHSCEPLSSKDRLSTQRFLRCKRSERTASIVAWCIHGLQQPARVATACTGRNSLHGSQRWPIVSARHRLAPTAKQLHCIAWHCIALPVLHTRSPPSQAARRARRICTPTHSVRAKHTYALQQKMH